MSNGQTLNSAQVIQTAEEIIGHRIDIFDSLRYLIDRNDKVTIITSECNDNSVYGDITPVPNGSVQFMS